MKLRALPVLQSENNLKYMLVSTAIFIIALVGLISLFVGKAFELRGARVAPLLKLREADLFVSDSARRIREHLPVKLLQIGESSFVLLRAHLHSAGLAAHNCLQSCSERFGEYLKKHNGSVSNNPGPVSSYLKNMVEYKQEPIQNADKKEIE